METGVCFMSVLWKWATSSKGRASGLWLVDFDPSSLFSMSKDGCRKITAIMCYARNTERSHIKWPDIPVYLKKTNTLPRISFPSIVHFCTNFVSTFSHRWSTELRLDIAYLLQRYIFVVHRSINSVIKNTNWFIFNCKVVTLTSSFCSSNNRPNWVRIIDELGILSINRTYHGTSFRPD